MLREAVGGHGGFIDGVQHVGVLDVLLVVGRECLRDGPLHRVRRRNGGGVCGVVVNVGRGLGSVRQDRLPAIHAPRDADG
jgi:hypothetical protein